MGFKPRVEEGDYVSRLLVQKERAIYWVCALLERDSTATREGARRALAELGYDQRRIESMLQLGEPGQRGAGENQRHAEPTYNEGRARRAAANRWVGRFRGPALRLRGRLLGYGPGNR